MIGDRIRAARVAKGWTQTQLASHMGLSDAYGRIQVGHWEAGRANLSPGRLERAASELGVSVDYLLGMGNEP